MKLQKSIAIIVTCAAGLAADVAWAGHSMSMGAHFTAHHSFVERHGRPFRPVPVYSGGGYYYSGGYYSGGLWPWYYPWEFGYAVPVLPYSLYTEQAAPVEYIEMNPSASPSPDAPSNVWYYCSNPQGYYPYVKSCDAKWRTVPAQPQQ